MYELIVQEDDDVVGLIAYALYKQHKRNWLIGFRAQRGREPNAEEHDLYLIGEATQQRIADYRDRARNIVASYTDVVVQSATPKIQRDAVTQEVTSALAWWKQIPAGIASAMTYTVLLIAIAFVLRYAGVDLLGVLGAVPPKP